MNLHQFQLQFGPNLLLFIGLLSRTLELPEPPDPGQDGEIRRSDRRKLPRNIFQTEWKKEENS